jgi:hypothetical protein
MSRGHFGSSNSVTLNLLDGSCDGRHRLDEVFHGNAAFHTGGRKATAEEIGLGCCLEGNSSSPGFDERFFARSLKINLKNRLEFFLDWL